MASETIAVYGGSFDPPHSAHLEVLHLLVDRGIASRVLVVPCIRHAFGKLSAPYVHRLAMCRLLCEEAGEGAEASDVEQRLGLSGLTVDTLEALAAENPSTGLRLVIGTDVLAERERWHRFHDIETVAPPIVVARRGFEGGKRPDLPAPAGISSTEVRSRIAAGIRPDDLVPPSILEYIERHGLYGFA